MHPDLILWLSSESGLKVHAALLTMLVLGGLGFPIPEDVPLVLGGMAASQNIVRLEIVFAVCYLGVMIGDQTMYLIGHFFGHKLLRAGARSPFFPAITEDRVNEVREGLRKHRLVYIFIGRHLFPIRSLTFVTAGALRVPFLEFLLADALAALVSVSLVMGLGYWLGGQITPETVQHIVADFHWYIVAIAVLSAIACLVLRRIKARRHSRQDALTTQVADSAESERIQRSNGAG